MLSSSSLLFLLLPFTPSVTPPIIVLAFWYRVFLQDIRYKVFLTGLQPVRLPITDVYHHEWLRMLLSKIGSPLVPFMIPLLCWKRCPLPPVHLAQDPPQTRVPPTPPPQSLSCSVLELFFFTKDTPAHSCFHECLKLHSPPFF